MARPSLPSRNLEQGFDHDAAAGTSPWNSDEVSAEVNDVDSACIVEHAASSIESPAKSGGFRWRDRPFNGGYFAGALSGDALRGGQVDDALGFLLSKRYGWDFANHWGLETRLAESWLYNSDKANPSKNQTEQVLFWDMDLLFYPWADSRWRPYASLGAGIADYNFVNEEDHRVRRVAAQMPLAIGVKYPFNEWLVARGELADYITFPGEGLPSMDNLSFGGGIEIRFGDLRKHFFGWMSRKR